MEVVTLNSQVKSYVSKDMKEIFDEDDDFLDENVEQNKEDLDGIDEFFDDGDDEENYEASVIQTSNSLDLSTSDSETLTSDEKASLIEQEVEAGAALEQEELAKEDSSNKSLESETEEQESNSTTDDKENVDTNIETEVLSTSDFQEKVEHSEPDDKGEVWISDSCTPAGWSYKRRQKRQGKTPIRDSTGRR